MLQLTPGALECKMACDLYDSLILALVCLSLGISGVFLSTNTLHMYYYVLCSRGCKFTLHLDLVEEIKPSDCICA